MPKSYARPTLRRVLKAHLQSAQSDDARGKPSLSKDVDVLAYLAYLSFLQKLSREARAEALAAGGLGAGPRGKTTVGKREVRRAAKKARALVKA